MASMESDGPALPAEFLKRLARIVPAHCLPLVSESFAAEKPLTFRINTLVDSRENTLNELRQSNIMLEPIEWLRDQSGAPIAYQTSQRNRALLTHSTTIDAGKIYLQNVSSMLAPLVLDPQSGETILDLAAAPGGKTIQIAQQMNNIGTLSAVEAVRTRMFKLQANLKRCNVQIARTYLTDGRTVGQKTPSRFDRVLLDAPCSSESRFRHGEPKSWATWSLRKLRETSRKQFGLLKAAVRATKVGGVIVYCTCSFSPEENERVVDKALSKFGDSIELEPMHLPVPHVQDGLTDFDGRQFDPRVKQCRRILPDHLWDAFFLAKFRKLTSHAE